LDWLLQTAIIVGMFILRLGIPLAITVFVGYCLRRLDDKWQAEAQARQAAETKQVQENKVSAPKPTALRTKHP
jgi:hypothetical protein